MMWIPELLTVSQDHVHVLVKGLELTNKGPGVLRARIKLGFKNTQ